MKKPPRQSATGALSRPRAMAGPHNERNLTRTHARARYELETASPSRAARIREAIPLRTLMELMQ